MLYALSIQLSFSGTIEVCKHSLEQQFPLLHEKREFLYLPPLPSLPATSDMKS